MTKIPLIIDTDPALGILWQGRPRDVDDGLAIVEAINDEHIQLLGVTAVFGNAPLSDTYRIAQELVALKQVEVPVLAGAAKAMPQQNGLGELSPAVAFLRDSLRKQPCYIAAIGPLTNIGILLAHYPELASQILQVVIVAGRSKGNKFYLGEVGPVRDFNFENDVRACEILLAADIAVVMVGFELSSQVVVTEQNLNAIKAQNTESASYLYNNSLAWFDHWTEIFSVDKGFHPWDSAAIAYFLRPECFVSEKRGWRISRQQLSEQEQKNNPDGSAITVPWLETSASFDGKQVTYITGFTDTGEPEFVNAMMAAIY